MPAFSNFNIDGNRDGVGAAVQWAERLEEDNLALTRHQQSGPERVQERIEAGIEAASGFVPLGQLAISRSKRVFRRAPKWSSRGTQDVWCAWRKLRVAQRASRSIRQGF
jgi:hypothetical protein